MYLIQISKDVTDVLMPAQIIFSTRKFDDYATLESVQDKADFLYTMIYAKYGDAKIYESLTRVQKHLGAKNISCVFNTPSNDVNNITCDENVSKFLEVCEKPDVLWCYLFSHMSKVFITNQ